MTESDAIARANRYVLEHQYVEFEPVEVHCVRRPESPVYWWISYGTGIYYPAETAAGATVDDGTYILKVDDATGEETVLQ